MFFYSVSALIYYIYCLSINMLIYYSYQTVRMYPFMLTRIIDHHPIIIIIITMGGITQAGPK